mgnify:CR=1 FL=1
MKKNIYSPDDFMASLYDKFRAEPYKNIFSYEDALKTGENIKQKAKELIGEDKIEEIVIEQSKIWKGTIGTKFRNIFLVVFLFANVFSKLILLLQMTFFLNSSSNSFINSLL